MNQPVGKNVRSVSAEVQAMLDASKQESTLSKGTAAMRAAGEEYLPKEPAEEHQDYANRLARSTLFNGLGKTVEDMSGKVFAKPVKLAEDAPEEFRGKFVKEGDDEKLVAPGIVENIDMAGRGLNNFAYDVFADGMVRGISYILVEMPPPLTDANGQPRTVVSKAEAAAAKRRPYFCHLTLDALLGWQTEEENGVTYLSQLRVLEVVKEPDPNNEWEKKSVEQVKVYRRTAAGVTWETYRKKDGNGTSGEAIWMIHDEPTPIVGPTEIPLAVYYAKRTGFMTAAPPLKKLGDINVAHWQSASDQRNILHVARVPILFGAGFTESDKLVVSANTFTKASDPAASLQWVEHSGSAIGAGRDDLNDLIFQMQTLGLELLIPKPGGDSATGAAIDDAKMNAPLAIMADNLGDALEIAFKFAAQFAGLGDDMGGTVVVNKDFGVSMRDASDITALLSAVTAGKLSRETFWDELLRRGVLKEGFNPEVEKDRIEQDPEDLGTMGRADPADGEGDGA